jgi:hypothetical protein
VEAISTAERTTGAPAFPVGGPTTTSWREHSLTRAGELQYLLDWITLSADPLEENPAIQAAAHSIRAHLTAAKQAAEGSPAEGRTLRWWSRLKVFVGGASVERANSNLDAAETGILQLAPPPYVEGQLQNLLAHVRGHLSANDPRRMRIEHIAALPRSQPLTDVERDAVVAAVRVASLESRREITRVRSFRNVLVVTACVLAGAMAGLVVLGILKPEVVPLCFHPEANEIVCPTNVAPVADGGKAPTDEAPPTQIAVDEATRRAAGPWDLPTVALVGLIAAAVAGATTLGSIKGTSTPYSLPIALAVLKLPTGALTAFLGLQLMRGEFVPGLSALDSPAQILAWAILFGYAQQLLTQFVDKQAQGVLDDVGRGNRPAEETPPVAAASPA